MAFDIATKELLTSKRQTCFLSGLLSFVWERQTQDTAGDVMNVSKEGIFLAVLMCLSL